MQESIETLRTELEGRLRFETLLPETSARFVNLPAEQIDGEIEDTQRRIWEFLTWRVLNSRSSSTSGLNCAWVDRKTIARVRQL